MALNEACNDNILTVKDDSPKGSGSELESPGRKARCGQSTFPKATELLTSDGVVTVSFKSNSNTGNSRFRLMVTGAIPNSCPAKVPLVGGCPRGPCCQGEDCCTITVGNQSQGCYSLIILMSNYYLFQNSVPQISLVLPRQGWTVSTNLSQLQDLK